MSWIEQNGTPVVLAFAVLASIGLFFLGSQANEDDSFANASEQPVPLSEAGSADPSSSDAAETTNVIPVRGETGSLSRGDIETIVREYILDNPEIIADALDKHMANREKLQELSAQQALKDNWDQLAFSKSAYATGPDEAAVTIVEFFDYNCGYCRQATPVLLDIAEKNKNVRVVFKEFPIRGEESFNVSRAALAAIKQDKYFELHRELMMSKGAINMARLEQVAEKLDIDVDKLRKDMNSSEVERAIEQNHLLADSLFIDGTPAFIVGDEIMRGWPGEERFERLVNDAVKAKKKG